MKRVYLDNAATTPVAPEIIDMMSKMMKSNFANPSSVHSFGRESKIIVEEARKKIAGLLNTSPGSIFFTSGGTEADNMALRCAVADLGVKRIITSCIEHHAVGHTANHLKDSCNIKIDLVKINDNGHVDIEHLEELLKESTSTIVSLMHANNEIGNLLDLKKVSLLCKKHKAYFHSDTVQTMGHYNFDLKDLDITFDSWYSEKKRIHDSDSVINIKKLIQSLGGLYKKEGAEWILV